MIGHNLPPDDDRNAGWIALQRDILDHPIIGVHGRPFTDTEAWIYLLCNAAPKARNVLNKGNMIILDPGQIMGAHGFLSERWLWSVDKVRWFLKRLETQAMIARFCAKHPNRRSTNQIQIITICNYSKYQFIQTPQHQATHQPEQQPNTKPTPSAHQANTKNLTLDRVLEDNRDKRGGPSFSPDEHDDVVLTPSGRVMLMNGFKAEWLDKFGGDEMRLEAALGSAAPHIAKRSPYTLRVQVNKYLSKALAWQIDDQKREKRKEGLRDRLMKYALEEGKK